jgi:hypothetical protein
MSSAPTRPHREYLVQLIAWSTHHVWIEADSEPAAERIAQQLWSQDENRFSCKDGGIDGVSVLDSREVQP